jgi:hypothetical protein
MEIIQKKKKKIRMYIRNYFRDWSVLASSQTGGGTGEKMMHCCVLVPARRRGTAWGTVTASRR